MTFFVPGDAAAVAVGADAVAAALGAEVIRNGSRGMFELEPLLEIETPEGRIGFARVEPGDVPAILSQGPAHPKCVGLVEELPFFKRQTRLTFARCGITDPQSMDDYKAHGGLKGLARAIELGAEATVEEVFQSGLRGRGLPRLQCSRWSDPVWLRQRQQRSARLHRWQRRVRRRQLEGHRLAALSAASRRLERQGPQVFRERLGADTARRRCRDRTASPRSVQWRAAAAALRHAVDNGDRRPLPDLEP